MTMRVGAEEVQFERWAVSPDGAITTALPELWVQRPSPNEQTVALAAEGPGLGPTPSFMVSYADQDGEHVDDTHLQVITNSRLSLTSCLVLDVQHIKKADGRYAPGWEGWQSAFAYRAGVWGMTAVYWILAKKGRVTIAAGITPSLQLPDALPVFEALTASTSLTA